MTQMSLPAVIIDGIVRGARKHEARKRDEALAALEEKRARLIAHGREVARGLAREHGTTTAPAVLATMRSDPEWVAEMARVDPRWAGALFVNREEWEGVRYESAGSRCRPVVAWKLR